MSQVTLKTLFTLAALLAVGPLAGSLIGSFRAADGGASITVLLNSSPVLASLACVGVFVLAAAVGGPAAFIFGTRTGMLMSGYVLAWAAWQTGTAEALVRRTQSGDLYWMLALEAAFVGLLLLALVAGVMFAGLICESRRDKAVRPDEDLLKDVASSVTTLAGLVGVLAAAVAGLVVAWAIAVEPLKGQAVFAGIFGGIAAAAAGRLSASFFSESPPEFAPYLGLALVAVGVPIWMAVTGGPGADLVAAFYAGTAWPPAYLLPLDWAAGAALGAPLGSAWVHSMVDSRTPQRA